VEQQAGFLPALAACIGINFTKIVLTDESREADQHLFSKFSTVVFNLFNSLNTNLA
jgi:hypothetical protein